MSKDVVIVSVARTPIGSFLGSLSSVSAPKLGSIAIKGALDKIGLSPELVDEVLMGNVVQSGAGQAPARQAAIYAGIPDSVPCTTVNKVCASGMKAIMLGAQSIMLGENDVVVAGGMESMSNAPHLLPPGARGGLRNGHGKLLDHMFIDGLEDAYTGAAMGTFAQKTADEHGLTREGMDAFAIESLTRAQRAIDDGLNQKEIAPVTIRTRRGEHTVSIDEQSHKANLEKIPQLRPAFAENGTITPANSSSISDGASALLLASEQAVETHGLTARARIVAHSRNSLAPEAFTLAPIGAAEDVLAKAGWAVSDVDLWEINEAFAMVTMLTMDALKLDPSCVNVHGGACAQGHPIGSTGSRIIVTLMHALEHYGKKRGVAALCIGGGEATAVAIELV